MLAVPEARGLRAVHRLCEDAHDARTLRTSVLQELHSAVGFDGHAWLVTDPLTWVGVAPVADVPWPGELPRQILLKYCTALNRWTDLPLSHVAHLGAVVGADSPGPSAAWLAFLEAHSVGDVASVVFADRHGCWGFLELFRAAARGPYAEEEMALLAGLVEPLTEALRRSQAECFVPGGSAERDRAGPVVLLLSPDLDVLGQTPDAHVYLRTLVPRAEHLPPIPASAYNAAAQLVAVERGVDDHPPSARVHLSDGLWVTVRAARISGPEPQERQNIAVTIEESSPAERLDLFARAFGLTARETDVLAHVAAGTDTKTLSGKLFLSQHTVQDHLKSIFAKTGTRTRASLLSRALGT